MIKAALLDFDGTLVTEDILSLITDIVGKKEESRMLDEAFRRGEIKGIDSLIERINLLRGVSLDTITTVLEKNDSLMPGAQELLDFLNTQKIVTILASGNIVPVLTWYQQKLRIDYVIGSKPRIHDNRITGISRSDYPDGDFKLGPTREILGSLRIDASETVAIGDSIADKKRFDFAGISIAINPKDGIEQYADFVISDLREVIGILQHAGQGGPHAAQ